MVTFLTFPSGSLTLVGCSALSLPHCIHHPDYFLLVYYKGVKNAFRNPGLGIVVSQLSTLISIY